MKTNETSAIGSAKWVVSTLLVMAASAVAAPESPCEEPRMLMRPVYSDTVLVWENRPEAIIVAPANGVFAEAAAKVQQVVREATGATLALAGPSDVTGKRGLMLTPEAKRKNLLFVGNLAVNSALFEPYVRRMLVADEEDPGRGNGRVVTHPNPWGTGVGMLLVGASDEAGIAAALDEFKKAVAEYGKPEELVLPRLYLPANRDPLITSARTWQRLARPKNEDWLKGSKKAQKMHLGYHVGRQLLDFTLITDLGVFNAEELNDVENEVLENMLMIPDKVWWYRSGSGSVGGRHDMFKNPRLYLAAQHILTVGKPNEAAQDALERLAQGSREYLEYCLDRAYRSDHEGTEDGHAWQSCIWFALLQGNWQHFESGLARDAAFYGLLQTDNVGGLAGHIQYGGVSDLYAKSTVRNAMRTAAWWYDDGRYRWLLENMQLDDQYAYGFPVKLPLNDVAPKRPDEWLGVQSLPVSRHSYDTSVGNGDWQQIDVPRENTFDLLSFRDGFAPDDQYLCIDGFQNHLHPLGLNSIVRYVDRGKLFLVSHTGKEGNYYKSGVVVSRGIQSRREPWGAELVAAANLPRVGLSATRFHDANGCDWTRCVFWHRGQYFLLLDDLVARESGQFNLTATWRTGHPAELTEDGWRQRQDGVTFWFKPAFPLDQRAGQPPAEEYQNEVVPYLLRQTLRLSAEMPGDRASFQNVIYATGPGDEQTFAARRVSATAALVRGQRKVGQASTTEFALVGIGQDADVGVPVETDARLYYMSPERVALADGTFLKWQGTMLARAGKVDDIEAEVPKAQRGKLSESLQVLWESARLQSQPETTVAKGVTLNTKWTHEEFKSHAPRVTPVSVESSTDGTSWIGRFDRPVDLASVVIVDDGLDPEHVTVDFSNDGFNGDVRVASAPAERSSRTVGPYGKSFFRTEQLLTMPGQQARDVRVTVAQPKRGAKPPIKIVELHAKQHEPAAITRLKTVDLDGDGTLEALALTRDNQFVVLQCDGQPRWQRAFAHNVLALEALDVDDDGKREILVCEANRDLHFIRHDGSTLKTIVQRTSENIYEDFFRFNRAYTMGLWRPKRGQTSNLILGTYQSVPWLTPKGDIVCWPPDSDEGKYRSGYVWRGLIYWEKTLPEGLDFNGDGIQDQAFIGRGWATPPTVMFFDGARQDAFAEYEIPSSRPLGLEVVRSNETTLILAATELHLGLYSIDGAGELWRVRFDTPAASYSLLPDGREPRILVAKRDGVVLTFDLSGKVIRRQLLSPELSAIAPIRIDDRSHVLVASDRGVTILTETLEPVGSLPTPATKLAPIGPATVLAATPSGKIVALTAPGIAAPPPE